MESALAITKASFPGNIEVWLKDLASLLNIKLEQCPEPDPIMKNKPKGIFVLDNALYLWKGNWISQSNNFFNFFLEKIILCAIWVTNARMWSNQWSEGHQPRPWSTCYTTALQPCCQRWTKVIFVWLFADREKLMHYWDG